MATKTLNELAQELYSAKMAEKTAKGDRIAIEQEIAGQVTIDGDKGSKTVDADNGLRLTVTRKINYKADVDAMRALDLPEGVIPVKHIPASWAFDATAYENIRENHPDVAGRLADCVTATPAKVSVMLKLG